MTVHKLFEALKMGDFELKNRIVLAPMTRGRAGVERIPNKLMAEYYYQRASAGLLITEATVVSAQGNGWVGSPGIYTEKMVEGWRIVTQKLKPTGTPIFLQLWHCGRASHSDFHNGALPVSASAVKLNGDQIRTPTNLRTDNYGCSRENKYRFLREVMAGVLEVWPSKRVGIRLSPNGVFNDMGSPDFRETYRYTIKELNRLNLAYVHIMDGLAFGFHKQGEPMTLAEFRAEYDGIIMGNCGYTWQTAEERLAAGHADLAAFGRPFITNPDLPERLRNNWPLNPADDMSLWYTPGAEGYTDYEPYRRQRL